MSIQRYDTVEVYNGLPVSESEDGEFVNYFDHVAEVERALAERDDWWTPAEHRKAVEAMRAACIKALEVLHKQYGGDEFKQGELALCIAIIALREVQP